MKPEIRGLYVITDTHIQSRFSHLDLARQVAAAGSHVIQLRDKEMSAGELLDTAIGMRKICVKYGCLFIVNDRVDIALLSDADGVHLGQNDLPIEVARHLLGTDKIIGGTASTMAEARQVAEDGADYIGFGHIYETQTKKKHYKARGVERLREVCKAVDIPVTAIGGITADRIPEIKEAGASAVAVCSAICTHQHPAIKTEKLLHKLG